MRAIIAIEFEKENVDRALGNTPTADIRKSLGELLQDWPIGGFEILSVEESK